MSHVVSLQLSSGHIPYRPYVEDVIVTLKLVTGTVQVHTVRRASMCAYWYVHVYVRINRRMPLIRRLYVFPPRLLLISASLGLLTNESSESVSQRVSRLTLAHSN